ncbi:DUF1269 domain-containing protein [Stieleria sp. ICT_E10.1]|uniref:DUF1269 domain-containing protein n=1 Tax=Stieleria sedimenti TaxID=2976331 RepID=UPI00217F9245|nr:DUF1269 domain-containing protein [Stieleria sedimenti]MCS7468454.1 DUF1269 domain-containing protein [Stieleria sedimenti]
MSKCLVAEYKTHAAAKVGLEELEQEHYTLKNISVVSSSTDPAAVHLNELHEEDEHSSGKHGPDGRSTSLGMLIGGTVAAPIAAGTLVGPFIMAGPLVGMAIGAAIGSLLGVMDRWGVDHDVSSDYAARVESGSVLVIVHDVDNKALNHAEKVLKATDPKTLERYEMD